MSATLTHPARIPFHFGIFYNAMVGLIGCAPHPCVCLGFDGFYDFIYQPADDAERKEFEKKAIVLEQYLDLFDITFSKSHCDLTGDDPNWNNVLRITISHPVAKE